MPPPPELTDLTATLEPPRPSGPPAPEAGSVDAPEATPAEDGDDALDEAPPDADDPGRYEFTAEHARGGLGRIVRAVDRRLGRTVAVKELHARSPRAEARFVREALITARLEHPGIVPVHEAGRWPSGEPYYVMKFVSGRTLKAAIGEATTWRARLALLPHVIAVADAVGYAHSQGIIHRDLKPSNVVVGEFGETVVVDWGLARDLRGGVDEPGPSDGPPSPPGPARGSTDTATGAGGIIGTPGYMAPEQAAGEAVDARADVYALGALMYEVLAGAPPYPGATVAEILAAVRAGPPPPLATVVPGLPLDLVAIVGKAMARAPIDRYADGRGLADDLRRFQTGQLVSAHTYGLGQRALRVLARHRGMVAAAGVGALALVVVGALSVQRVVTERNAAQGERARAVEAQRAAEARQRELVKVQARTSLGRDPTAAVAWLKTYRPQDDAEAREQAALLDEARAAGVARHVWRQGDWVRDAVVSPDGAHIASASSDGKVRVYDVASGATTHLGQVTGSIQVVRWAPDGQSLITGTSLGDLLRWPLGGGVPTSIGPRRAEPIADLAWSEDGADLIVGFAGAPPELVHPAAGAAARATPLEVPDDAIAMALHAGTAAAPGWRLVYGTLGGELVVRDASGARVLLRRASRIGAVALDGAGQRVAAHDGTQVWVVDLGRDLPPVAIGAYPQPATWLTLSPSGNQLAIGGDDHAITVWQLGTTMPTTAVPARALRGHTDAVYGVAFSRGGGRLVSASDDGTARVWNLITGDVDVLRGHADDVYRARLTPDERAVVTAGLDGSVRLWPLGGVGEAIFGPEPGPIVRARLIDDDTVAVAGLGFGTRIELATGVRAPLHAGRSIDRDSVGVLAPDGRTLVALNDDLSLQLWRDDGTSAQVRGPGDLPIAGDIVDDSRTMMIATRDGTTWSLDLASARATLRWQRPGGEPATAGAFNHAGTLAVSHGGVLTTWSATAGATEISRGAAGCLRFIEFEPGGERFVGWDCDGQSWLFTPGQAPRPLDAPPGHRPVAMAWSADGASILAALTNRTAVVWDAGTGAIRQTLRGHGDLILAVALSPDGTRAATGSYDRTLRVWDLASGDSRVLRGHGASVDFVAWRRSGTQLVSAGRDGTVRVWPAPPVAIDRAELARRLDEATSARLGEADEPTTPAR